MALGILLIIFIALFVLAVAGLLVLHLVKHPPVNTGAFILLLLLSLLVAYMSATAGPSNYVLEKVTAVVWGLLAVVAAVLQFGPKKHPQAAKWLVSASIVIGLAQFYFI